ncbi:ABC transporter ATP-binding protein [Weissella viridescens]|uniref:ABC transporter ATP-binding protein n=2 Tax=Weissella viridescens TaxID=1629 RepID=UPI001C7DBDA0|nr:ABC transporter ATP-binding protein [Weissella viridescens]MBX4173461.1 ABC transporter ATP-binding protein [Weissella viridescens]MCB6840822.1 ABC transporter ATP-binding protein [Weissella viridescens]MCB6847555.1 ABC transporter ATP-binding protein [Weissella viridescens]WJI91138.1 ABC transporter ATP-binding protein [Weissella viridescens]
MLELKQINKFFMHGKEKQHVLKDINITINDGEFVAIMGHSGSGKSTLLNIIGLLDRDFSGSYLLNGRDTRALSKKQYTRFRNENVGWVFQNFKLIDNMTVADNVGLPLQYQGKPHKEIRRIVEDVLAQVGILDKADTYPKLLSGGQQQRVAIARAIVTNPNIVIADEPTGALDSATTIEIMDVFRRLNAAGTTLIIVTHDASVGEQAERLIKILDGQVMGADYDI